MARSLLLLALGAVAVQASSLGENAVTIGRHDLTGSMGSLNGENLKQTATGIVEGDHVEPEALTASQKKDLTEEQINITEGTMRIKASAKEAFTIVAAARKGLLNLTVEQLETQLSRYQEYKDQVDAWKHDLETENALLNAVQAKLGEGESWPEGVEELDVEMGGETRTVTFVQFTTSTQVVGAAKENIEKMDKYIQKITANKDALLFHNFQEGARARARRAVDGLVSTGEKIKEALVTVREQFQRFGHFIKKHYVSAKDKAKRKMEGAGAAIKERIAGMSRNGDRDEKLKKAKVPESLDNTPLATDGAATVDRERSVKPSSSLRSHTGSLNQAPAEEVPAEEAAAEDVN